jgi:hypothetical protein
MTDSIRAVFREVYPKGLTPTQVRDKLIANGFDLSTQANPMASIHSVIKRLLTAGEIEPWTDGAPASGAYRRTEQITATEAALAQAQALTQRRGLASTILTNPMDVSKPRKS